jgi:hypothetical protein
MRIFTLIIFITFGLSACNAKWEYKTVTVKGTEDITMGKYKPKNFGVDDESLNLFGKDGWELVSVYQKTETVTPNYGNEEYVSGLQPNVRTSEISFVFKRKK